MKKALFIPLGFYDYDRKIEHEIKKNGFAVSVFNPIGKYSFFEKVINTLSKGKYLANKAYKRQEKFFSSQPDDYDVIFVIVGRFLEPKIFSEFCFRNRSARKVLYLWDDVGRVENFDDMKDCFDDIYSFDNKDVEKYNFKMLPLFYTEFHVYNNEKKTHLFSLMGLLHSERIKIFDQIVKQCNLTQENCFVYLLGAKLKDFLTWVNPKRSAWTGKKYIHIKGMPFEKCAEIMKESKVALDVQFGSQNGLTLRTFETLASHTKLITTNKNVMQYDFYNPNNIYIIDRDHPIVDKQFFDSEYEVVNQDIVEQYSLENWIKKMIG